MNKVIVSLLVLAGLAEVFVIFAPHSALGSLGPLSFANTAVTKGRSGYITFVEQEVHRPGSYFNPHIRCGKALLKSPYEKVEAFSKYYDQSTMVWTGIYIGLFLTALIIALIKMIEMQGATATSEDHTHLMTNPPNRRIPARDLPPHLLR